MVIIIIGLPGSGKTTLLKKLCSTNLYTTYQDWAPSQLDLNGNVLSKFENDVRYEDLISQLESSKDVILDGANFCDHKFLCDVEYKLNLQFPEIEIKRCYFENNPTSAIANVLYRDALNGGYWTRNEKGKLVYSGSHYSQEGPNFWRRFYEVIIDDTQKLTKNYIIPKKYIPHHIQIQDKNSLQGHPSLKHVDKTKTI